MTFKSNVVFFLFVMFFGLICSSLTAQTTVSKNNITYLKTLHRNGHYDSILKFTQPKLQKAKVLNRQDSLLYAKLYYYQYLGLHKTNKSIQNMSSIDKGISFCPNSQTGDSLKAVFYNKKAYLESELGSSMKSYKNINKAIKLLENLPNSGAGLMGAYLLLSTENAYFGNFEQARYNMRLAEDAYAKNKTFIDNNTWELNGNNHRLGVILKYRKTYMLWKLSKDSKDSTTLLHTMKLLENMHNQPDFHKEERIYYSTALNHIGDWFVSHKHDSLTTQKDVSEGLKHLFKSLHLIENKGYPGTIWAVKYNIAKAFTRGNQLEKADSTIAVLFNGISKTDGRLPFFLAQKALIKAKKNQKDSALFYFHQSIQKVHQGEDDLRDDYSNFKPSKSYNHTRLLLRIDEELNRFYQKDSILQKKIAILPFMALQQFENSYLDVTFNSNQNKQLRKIIQGILRSKRTGYREDLIPEKTILNKFEIFKNQLAWKKFYENRYTNLLPELDVVKDRQLELASLLASAKIKKDVAQQDSVKTLIDKHNSYKKKRFPQLNLLSNFEFSVEELQDKLSSEDLVIKYVLLDNEIVIYQISKDDLSVEVFPWKANEKNLLRSFVEKSSHQAYSPELAMQLGELLLPSLTDATTNLIINPDGALFKLPFEILQLKGTLIAEQYNVRYTSNLGFIHHTPDHTAISENIHIYAPKYNKAAVQSKVRDDASFLMGASNEAKTISKLFPSRLYNDENLTKSEFIKTAGKAKVLHLAMHAEVNNDFSEFSRLLFSNNLEKESEHLYLEELYSLSLSADLAILSACNTGNGLQKNGNLESFQRAFTFAGVPATVASLWEVPDKSTKEIMVLFYQNLKEGLSKSEALRNAKLMYRKNHEGSRLSAPYFWAGFVVYGSDTPISDEPFSTLTFVLIAVIATPIIWYRRRKWKAQHAA